MYSRGTWFVSGICVWIPYIKETMMMMMMMMIITKIIIIIIIHQSDPSIGRSIKIARQLEKVFEPCLLMFRDLKGGGGEGQ
jgi:hypothetical protein